MTYNSSLSEYSMHGVAARCTKYDLQFNHKLDDYIQGHILVTLRGDHYISRVQGVCFAGRIIS